MRLFVVLFALGLAACERDGAVVLEPQYASKIVGSWQGTVAGQFETIGFYADGDFTAKINPTGFINTTLDQGKAGSIGGSWALQGKIITLNITSAENERPANLSTTSSIVSFSENKLVIHSDGAGNSTFIRVHD